MPGSTYSQDSLALEKVKYLSIQLSIYLSIYISRMPGSTYSQDTLAMEKAKATKTSKVLFNSCVAGFIGKHIKTSKLFI